ncbi:hypothetical protein D5R81_19715 [Parashewanella spongiae]|uniref:Uncharacterized protein n=1 Tax=Parashewanella spongiae TaxID=342950 RepID=A0A3A6T5F7_9GAMM|nr:hypothetical protein [Parashewanella spongiae]MCL1080245.1 hypothetical protein [Parashewanella spongiae]RJY01890.1 hypothetical protein D5R81_19715 [Parashewanella spongiae]
MFLNTTPSLSNAYTETSPLDSLIESHQKKTEVNSDALDYESLSSDTESGDELSDYSSSFRQQEKKLKLKLKTDLFLKSSAENSIESIKKINKYILTLESIPNYLGSDSIRLCQSFLLETVRILNLSSMSDENLKIALTNVKEPILAYFPSDQLSLDFCFRVIKFQPLSLFYLPIKYSTPVNLLHILNESVDTIETTRVINWQYFSIFRLNQSELRQSLVKMVKSRPEIQPHTNSQILLKPPRPKIMSGVCVNYFSYSLKGLISTLEECLHFYHPNEKLGNNVAQYIDDNFYNLDIASLPISTEVCLANIIYGNRSVAKKEADGNITCFKFLREGEAWSEFLNEMLMHQASDKFGLSSKLDSDFIKPISIFKVHLKELPQEQQFKTCLHIESDKKGEKWVIGYQFKTTLNYIIYCFTPKSERTIEWSLKRAENGIIKSISDLAFMASCGIYYHSVIPIFHHGTERVARYWERYCILQDAQEKPSNKELDFKLGGIIRCWLQGVARSDFGFSGLRDRGDSRNNTMHVSLHDKWEDSVLFRWFDCKKPLEKELDNKLDMMNSVCSYFLGAMLTFAACNREQPSYNCDNLSMVTKTEKFFITITDKFLARATPHLPNCTFSSFFGDVRTFNALIKKVAHEIVFFTEVPNNNCDHHKTLPSATKYHEDRLGMHSGCLKLSDGSLYREEIYMPVFLDTLIFLAECYSAKLAEHSLNFQQQSAGVYKKTAPVYNK